MKPRKNSGWHLAVFSAALCSSLAQADDTGAIKSLTDFDINETAFLKDLGISVGGWVSAGVAGNPDSPESRTNGPVTFNNRANEFNMHELYGYIERAVDTEADNLPALQFFRKMGFGNPQEH
ncbi:MAG: outer membrane beta-barrel protein, partial [Gammaproteobacteria bacterium]